MSKFHINSKGEAGPCSASKGKCPFGGESGVENHFDSMEAAAVAAMEKEFANDEAEALKKEAVRRATISDYHTATPEEAEALLTSQAIAANAHRIYDYLAENGLDDDSDVREAAFAYASEDLGMDYEQLYDAFVNEEPLADKHQEKPSSEQRVTQADGSQGEVVATDTNKGTGETFYQTADGFWHKEDEVESSEPAIPQEWQSVLETNKREAIMSVYGNTDPQAVSDYLTRPDVEAMTLDQFNEHLEEVARTSGKNGGRFPIGNRGHRYGTTREGKEEAARLQEIASLERKSRVAGILASSADSKKESIQHRNEQSRYNSQISELKYAQELHKASKAHKAGKPLDPQMVQALERSYLKKFHRTPQEDGVSTGQLLQMAQKGEI